MTVLKANELPKIEAICEQISDLDLGIALVWVYVWDVVRGYYDDPQYQIKDKETVWNGLCKAVSEGWSFSLEYGAEELHENIQDWLIKAELMIDLDDVEEEEETDNQAGETNE